MTSYTNLIQQMKEEHKKYIETLSEESIELLKEFTGVSLMMEQLRHSARSVPGNDIPFSLKKKREVVKKFNAIFENAPKSLTDINAFRGSDPGQYSCDAIGAKTIDYALSSASLDVKIAESFVESKGGELVKIIIPIGSPFLYIESISSFPTEQELLLPWGSVFEVVQIKPPILKLIKCDAASVFSEKRVNINVVDHRKIARQIAKEQQQRNLEATLKRNLTRKGGKKNMKKNSKRKMKRKK
tara:strand:- start:319 stop:1044 length:726 start_codon:yes stop_codon:yes gene_type:complete